MPAVKLPAHYLPGPSKTCRPASRADNGVGWLYSPALENTLPKNAASRSAVAWASASEDV